MIQIGKYRFGFLPVSMIVVFILLSICAILTAIRQARPEWPMPLWNIILINEGMALLGTLVYGIIVHLAKAAMEKFINNDTSYFLDLLNEGSNLYF